LFSFAVNVTAKVFVRSVWRIPELEITSAVNKVNGIECPVAWSGEAFGGRVQRLAKHQNDNND
jgi:hypothetical protein